MPSSRPTLARLIRKTAAAAGATAVLALAAPDAATSAPLVASATSTSALVPQPGRSVDLGGGGDRAESATDRSGKKRAAKKRRSSRRGTRRTSRRPAAATAARYYAPAAGAALRFTTPRGADALSSDLGAMLNAKVRSGQWGAIVVSLTRHDTLFRQNADAEMQPASTMKLFTSALALDRFGPDWQFSTDVLRDGPVDDGTLKGDLILRGDGDPALSNRFLRGEPDAPMELLAKFVAGQGIKHVTGDVIGDATAFDQQRIPEGWLNRYLGAGYAARVSALSLDENVVWVAAYPAEGRGPARVVLEPATTAYTLTSNVRTVPGSSGGSVVARKSTDGHITVSGWIGSRSIPRKYSFVVDDPAAFTAGAFRAALAAQGVKVDGQVRLAATPSNAVKVTSLPSPPLSRLVSAMNRESINHYAELLFRNAARGPKRAGVGSAQTGEAALHQFLTQKVGVSPSAVDVSDGSGLSTLDHLTPRAMVQLLAYADAAPWGPAFHASLPVAGESELLRHRMKYTPAMGNLHAKTGTTNSVISLGGYVTAQDGEVLAFAFIYNGNDRWNAKETIDRMGATLAGFARE